MIALCADIDQPVANTTGYQNAADPASTLPDWAPWSCKVAVIVSFI